MPHMTQKAEPDWYAEAIDPALLKLARLRDNASGFPLATTEGKWRFSAEGTWTAGFWPGRLWIGHLLSGDDAYLDTARNWCQRLAPHQLNRTTHDLGMMFMPSFVAGWRITGDPALHYGALAAAETLAARFNTRGRFLRAIGAPGTVEQAGYTIVDTLMNLPLLLWASRETGERRLAEIAMAHARTSMGRHLRPDGSTLQVFNFDPETGEPLGPGVHQGISSDSCWSRGQAWAISGLATIYRLTGDADVLAGATRAADWWLGNAPGNTAPPWDFAAGNDAPRDSSASAIAACGLIDLANSTNTARYRRAAEAMLHALWATCTDPRPAEEGLLRHATGFLPAGRDVDVSLSYGDYFYLLGLLHLTRPELYAKSFEIGVT